MNRDIRLELLGEAISRKILISAGSLMTVEVHFKEGGVGAPHAHEGHEQTSYIVKGRFEVCVDGETSILQAGDSFYAGKSYVRADYTFICLGQPSLHHIKEISLNIKPALDEKLNLAMPDDSGMMQTPLNSGKKAVLSVNDQTVCGVGLEGNITTAEGHLDGWSVLADEEKYIGVAVRDFWHLCPKAIEVSSDNIKKPLA